MVLSIVMSLQFTQFNQLFTEINFDKLPMGFDEYWKYFNNKKKRAEKMLYVYVIPIQKKKPIKFVTLRFENP